MKKYYKYTELKKKEQQKITQSSVLPRPIAWITTLNENGTVNLAPFSYFSQFSPSLLAVSFTKEASGYKDTYLNLIREKEAVVNIADVSLLKQLDESSRDIPYNTSELEGSGLHVDQGIEVKTPPIKEALINFEVVLEDEMAFSDLDGNADNNVVFLRIVSVHIDDSVFDEEKVYVLSEQLRPIARLGGPNYSTIKPINFKRKHT